MGMETDGAPGWEAGQTEIPVGNGGDIFYKKFFKLSLKGQSFA